MAVDKGLVKPVLVGHKEEILKVCEEVGLEVPDEDIRDVAFHIDSVVGILSGKKLDKESEWYTSDTMISAPEGYMISLNGENENWTDRIDITEDGLNTINYFLKNIETEYVSHPEKMEVKKYCPRCNKMTVQKEKK